MPVGTLVDSKTDASRLKKEFQRQWPTWNYRYQRLPSGSYYVWGEPSINQKEKKFKHGPLPVPDLEGKEAETFLRKISDSQEQKNRGKTK